VDERLMVISSYIDEDMLVKCPKENRDSFIQEEATALMARNSAALEPYSHDEIANAIVSRVD
jgi:hypothetical protein